jgi:hypothetical protein
VPIFMEWRTCCWGFCRSNRGLIFEEAAVAGEAGLQGFPRLEVSREFMFFSGDRWFIWGWNASILGGKIPAICFLK